MQQVLRPYVTAGVVLAGASMIAATPAAMPLPAVQPPQIQLTAAGGLDAYIDLFGDTFNNLSNIAGQVLDAPAPILSQIAANQLGSLTGVVGGLQTSLSGIAGYFTGDGAFDFAGQLQTAFDAISAGDFANGFTDVFNAFVLLPAFQALGLLTPLNAAIEMPFENAAAAVTAGLQNFLLVGLGLIAPPASLMHASGTLLETLVASTGDPMEFVQQLLGAPAFLLNTVINGMPGEAGLWPGLLSPGLGLAEGILSLRTGIADAIAPAVPFNLMDGLEGLFSGPGLALGDIPQDLMAALGSFDPTQLLDFGNLGDLFTGLPFIGDILTALLTSF